MSGESKNSKGRGEGGGRKTRDRLFAYGVKKMGPVKALSKD